MMKRKWNVRWILCMAVLGSMSLAQTEIQGAPGKGEPIRLSPATQQGVGRVHLAALPDLVRYAYAILERATYPLKDRDALLDYLAGKSKGSADIAFGSAVDLLAGGLAPEDFPLRSADSAVARIHAKLSRAIPNPEPPSSGPRERPSLEELDRALREGYPFEVGDHACAQAAKVRFEELRFVGSIVLNAWRLRQYAEECHEDMPTYPPGYCGDLARRAYADRYIRFLMPDPSPRSVEEWLEPVDDEARRQEARTWAAGWAEVVYSICQQSLAPFPGQRFPTTGTPIE